MFAGTPTGNGQPLIFNMLKTEDSKELEFKCKGITCQNKDGKLNKKQNFDR